MPSIAKELTAPEACPPNSRTSLTANRKRWPLSTVRNEGLTAVAAPAGVSAPVSRSSSEYIDACRSGRAGHPHHRLVRRHLEPRLPGRVRVSAAKSQIERHALYPPSTRLQAVRPAWRATQERPRLTKGAGRTLPSMRDGAIASCRRCYLVGPIGELPQDVLPEGDSDAWTVGDGHESGLDRKRRIDDFVEAG